jgi:hypothetical protein
LEDVSGTANTINAANTINIDSVKKTGYYQKVLNTVMQVKHSGLIAKGFGQCLSMSDIILKLLYKEGIDSELVECSLMIFRKEPPGMFLVGYPGFIENHYDQNERMENHIICITKTDIPILIDLSVTSIDGNIEFICEPILKEEAHADIAEFNFANSTWTYQTRPITGLPRLYEKSILKRMQTDNKVERELKFIKTFLYIMFTVSFMNFTRGFYDFYLTFYAPNGRQANVQMLEQDTNSDKYKVLNK